MFFRCGMEDGLFKALVFDIQGTLINVEDILSVSLGRVLARHGLEKPDSRTMRLYRILSPYTFVKEYYGLEPDVANAMSREILAERDALYGSRARAYDGAAEVLASLKGKGLRLYAASHKSRAEAEELLDGTGIRQFFDGIYQKLSRGAVLELVALGSGLPKDEMVYVGDCIDDMDEAERAGVAFIPSMYGYGFERGRSSVPYPVPVLYDISDLPAALERLEELSKDAVVRHAVGEAGN